MIFRLGCKDVKLVMSCIFVWSGSKISEMSSTYRKFPAILCFSVRCVKWIFSRFCRKNSAIRDGNRFLYRTAIRSETLSQEQQKST